MNEVRKRMRAWAPKSRSGCLACKHRRVRCDEGRPRCKPCEKRNVDCVYLAPKTWLFEGKAAQQDSSSPSSAVTILSPPVTTPWGSAEETRALQFFLERAAPWLSGFSPFDAHTLWSVSVPRIAAITPAIKSLLTAFTLLEIPIRDATTFELRARSQAILRHYTHGLHQLRKPSLSTAESSLGPVLAWAIEVHNIDHKRAQMHIHGAKVLHARVLQSSSRNLSHEDYVHDTNLEDLFAYMNMWHWIRARILPPMLLAGTLTSAPALAATSSPLPSPTPTPTPSSFSPSSSSTTTRGTRTPTPSSTPIDIGLTTSLTTLNTHITPTHSSTVRAAFVHYFSHIHTPSMTPLQLDAARFYLLGWERTIFQNKYLTKEASVVFNALNLLCNLAAILLPVPLFVAAPEGHGKGEGVKTEEEDKQKAEGTIGMGMSNIEENTKRQEEEQNSMELALSHILRRCEWMLGLKFGKNKHGVEQGDERDAEELRETVELVLRATRWLAPIEGPRRKAGEMLREMGVEGSGERVWDGETSERHGVVAFG